MSQASYECTASQQDRPYAARPSRTQQLLDPKLAPKLTNDAPKDLTTKLSVAEILKANKPTEGQRDHNIDYDDIKRFIKEQTTPGQGKAIAVPGRGDDNARQFEDDLFFILEEQHHRIDLFVKSKAREIQHRLDDAKKRLRHLSSRSLAADRRVPVTRLERYGRLENDVLKAGEDIKSLARFTGTQRTAFRKLMKKYKKWTGSVTLEERLREQVLDDPKSFTKFDLAPLLDVYSGTLHDVRTLYETKVQQPMSGGQDSNGQTPQAEHASLAALHQHMSDISRTDFDTAFAAIPLGETGTFSSYFVHPDNVVELQVLLLQHARYLDPRSRANSVAAASDSSQPPLSRVGSGSSLTQSQAGMFHALLADNAERFVQEQGALTVDEREHSVGSTPQRAKICARWSTGDEEAVIAARIGQSSLLSTRLKPKHFATLFNTKLPLPTRRASLQAKMSDLEKIREVLASGNTRPLYQMNTARSRYVGLSNTAENVLLATIDTNVTFASPSLEEKQKESDNASRFPFAVLQTRQEGALPSDLAKILDHSHLVERVRGFSMEYHGIWELCKPPGRPAPFWLPTLERDIRKLRPPALKRNVSTQGTGAGTGTGSQSPSATLGSASNTSGVGLTDSMTANELSRPLETTFESPLAEAPPLRAFRKKRKRVYPPAEPSRQAGPTYWSEYDHPEDGDEGGDAYMIYIDPNQKSSIEAFFDRLGGLFLRKRKSDSAAESPSPSSPSDDESSDDDETTALARPRGRGKSYGALPTLQTSVARSHRSLEEQQQSVFFLPLFAATSLVASLVILVVGYILAATGRHKFVKTVDAGVVFAVVTSLLFAVVGFGSLLRKDHLPVISWAVATGSLVVAAVGNGGLLAWTLG
ncbi:hypothetical protein B0A48_09090 [Cryoendolithus antarcticus]|uniref:SPX domain-containing protein n=1 Tax=Cryoendolithus antarcticus TaxID=1507870 RepID=A0A1V8T2C7_9PEZI|nr:hypothetical protein B0A48_09090 [Cryoendolithus antarcticus]